MPIRQVFKLNKGGKSGHPQNQGQQGQNLNAPIFVPQMQVVNQPVTAPEWGAQPQ